MSVLEKSENLIELYGVFGIPSSAVFTFLITGQLSKRHTLHHRRRKKVLLRHFWTYVKRLIFMSARLKLEFLEWKFNGRFTFWKILTNFSTLASYLQSKPCIMKYSEGLVLAVISILIYSEKLVYSQNWNLDRSNLDGVLQKIAAFDHRNDVFLRFNEN